MVKKLLLISLLLVELGFLSPTVRAEEYVLPYPSAMPGNYLYKLKLIWEKVQEFWSFGNFAKFSYNLKESDKYLVEAKTLFEYNQYLLATKALKKSDEYFSKIPVFLEAARKEGKNTENKKTLLGLAAQKHKAVLGKLLGELPPEFNWQPEKEKPTLIPIRDLLENSIRIRSLE